MRRKRNVGGEACGVWRDLGPDRIDFDGHVLMRIHLGMIAVMLIVSGVKFSSIQNNVI